MTTEHTIQNCAKKDEQLPQTCINEFREVTTRTITINVFAMYLLCRLFKTPFLSSACFAPTPKRRF